MTVKYNPQKSIKMKNITFITLSMLFLNGWAQVSGNINYQQSVQFNDNNINIPIPNATDFSISIKGMANLKAYNYVAIFSVSQAGITAKEVDSLFNKRLNFVLSQINKLDSASLFVDMVSFVPVYSYSIERKLFSKNTNNEIPDGFELKKNLHINYKDPSLLSNIISICANAEIYNLVRVDYFSSEMDKIKLVMLEKSREVLDKRLAHYKSILKKDLTDLEKKISDGFRVFYPTEMYQNCVAYENNKLRKADYTATKKIEKDQTQHYQPIVNKEFDFVLNPLIVEPVIQVLYEIKLTMDFKEEPKEKPEKKVILVTPNGDLKTLELGG